MRQKKEIDWETVDALRERGVKWSEIAATLNIPRGTLTSNDYRRRVQTEKAEAMPNTAPAVTVKEEKRPGLDSFKPRDLMKHLYGLGYRVDEKGIYIMVNQYVNLQSVINE